MLLAGFLLSAIADTGISIANTDIPDSEVTSSQSEANNSSASATITIRMYTLPDK